MLNIVPATTTSQRQDAKDLLTEYLQFIQVKVQEEFGEKYDIEAALEHALSSPEFAPPGGCQLIAYDDDVPTGCVCMRTIGPGIAELKRMYVRPAHRRRGIGRLLCSAVVERAREMGCHTLRLDSASFLPDSHRLYRALGFRERRPYPESEIPPQFHDRCVFMELAL